MSDVPAIPPLTTIEDVPTQRVLKPLVDGWNTRNGESDKGFVTVGAVREAASMRRAGSGGSVAGGQAVKHSSAASALADLVIQPGSSSDLEARIQTIEGDEWFRTRFEQYKDKIVDVGTGGTVQTVATTHSQQNVKAYASDGTANGLTLDIAANSTIFMNGTLTLRRNAEYKPYQWQQIVTDVQLVNGALNVVKKDILTTIDGDYSNGGWLFCWIEVKNLDNGVTTQHGYSIHVPHGAVFLKAPVHAVATCSVAGRYKFNVVADGTHALYGFGDIKGTQRVPLSLVVCGG